MAKGKRKLPPAFLKNIKKVKDAAKAKKGKAKVHAAKRALKQKS